MSPLILSRELRRVAAIAGKIPDTNPVNITTNAKTPAAQITITGEVLAPVTNTGTPEKPVNNGSTPVNNSGH